LVERGHRVELRAGAPITDHPYEVRNGGGKFAQYLRSPVTHARHHRDADLVVDIANGMAFYSPLWRRSPTICFVHHVHTEQWSQWFPAPIAGVGRNLERWAMPQAYRNCLFVTVSESSADSLVDLGVRRESIRIVPNGVDIPTRTPVKSAEPTFVALGRLVPHKQYELMAEVWKRVHPVTGGKLILVGEGPEFDRIAAVGAPAMEMVGRVSDDERDRLLAEAWMLVHPSMLEGWGLVVMEAAACSTPTIGFDAPGVRDSVVHTETGMLANNVDELAEFWTELSLDHDLRTKLGAGARDRADMFGWDQTVQQFEAVAVEAVRTGEHRSSSAVARPAPVAAGAPSASDGRPTKPASRRELFKLFLNEKTDPDPFYSQLAERSIAEFTHDVRDRLVLDLGCGHGYDTGALRRAGAEVVPLDLDPAKLTATGTLLDGALQGDAHCLPFADATFDGIYCSNLLEHTPAVAPVLSEIERVLKPGGWAWMSWTNWYSPWGGHEIVPLHFLGPHRGYDAWVKLFGIPRVNIPYHELWPTYIGQVLDLVDRQAGLSLVDAKPRYWPSQRWILKVPGLREVATWNCVLELTRVEPPPSA
jgi:glycosyltransferase involved in cell wall biosynthesis/SAM-dependent methyltransferase